MSVNQLGNYVMVSSNRPTNTSQCACSDKTAAAAATIHSIREAATQYKSCYAYKSC
jgi:hypothetical protein